MGIFFGTDGIRGVVNEELSYDLAFKCGNALASTKENVTILIGKDTRLSGDMICTAFACGAICAGAKIIDVGICTTPCVAYLTKTLKANFGVVISASHNPSKYNGIKIFDSNGYKLLDADENALERKFVKTTIKPYNLVGTYTQNFSYVDLYVNYLKKICLNGLCGQKIVIDASNGGAYKIAPKIFKSLGAEVVCTSCDGDGENINNNCGSLYPSALQECVLREKADMGFAFDGDADRIIACDEKGNLLDGDILTYIFAMYLKEQNKLNFNKVVGTRHTNMGLEIALKENDIRLVRTDIGDKYVLEQMLLNNLSLGGEKSGHIIFKDYATTGDGVLCAVMLSSICKQKNKSISELFTINLYPQTNIDVVVNDKMRIINNENLSNVIEQQEKELPPNSRIMVRVSGTEPKIRIMVESLNENAAKISAKIIEQTIKQIDGGNICAE